MEVNEKLVGLITQFLSIKSKQTPSAKQHVLLFFSFDIVNSSLYKSINEDWYLSFKKIFGSIANKTKNEIPKALFWRVIGDEIIFFVRITNMEYLYTYIDNIYKILISSINDIKNSDNKFANIYISLKASAWLALLNNIVTEYENIEYKPGLSNVSFNYDFRYQYGQSPKEFLGPDMDAGFRVSNYRCERRLSVSFELAYLLSENYDCKLRLHIITYRNLKGIWNNSLYPIIWYYNPTYHKNTDFADSFFYDEIEKK